MRIEIYWLERMWCAFVGHRLCSCRECRPDPERPVAAAFCRRCHAWIYR